jgi:hypothetical protein
VVLVDHSRPRIERWTRSGGAWRASEFTAGERVSLDPIGCALLVDDVYAAARDA